MAIRIIVRVLRRPAWKRRGDWSRRSTDRHSVLLGLMPIGPFIACRVVAWPSLGHTAIHLYVIFVGIHHGRWGAVWRSPDIVLIQGQGWHLAARSTGSSALTECHDVDGDGKWRI